MLSSSPVAAFVLAEDLVEARDDIRRIARESFRSTIAWTGVDVSPFEGAGATVEQWQAELARTGQRCPHPVALAWTTRNRRGGCNVCGRCYHTVINRGDHDFGGPRESAWCDDCGEERPLRSW